MKYFFTSILLLFFYSIINAQDLSDDKPFPEQNSNSTGTIAADKIKTETIYSFNFSTEKIDSAKAETITYDTQGNIIAEEISLDNSALIHINNSNNSTIKRTYIFSTNGKLQEIIKEDGKSEFKYDSSGNKIMQYNYNKDNTRFIKFVFTYDNQNRLIEKQEISDDDKIQTTKKYYYVGNGKINKIELYNAQNSIMETYKYNLSKTNIYKSAYWQHSLLGQSLRDKYTFNGLGQLITHEAYTAQPILYMNQDNNSLYKKEYQIVPSLETRYSYNSDGTLFETTFTYPNKPEMNNRINGIRKHYYTYY